MRSIKLVPFFAAAATLLALAPAGASARRAHKPRPHAAGPCHIQLETTKAPISFGEPTTVFGTIKCPATAQAAGRQITLLQQSAPKAGFAAVGTATTEATKDPRVGAFAVTPPIFTTNSVFYAVSEGAQSAHRAIRVTAQITVAAPTPPDGAQLLTAGGPRPRRHNRVTFAGEVGLQDAGSAVTLQREASTATEEWRAIDRGTVDGQGKYSIVHSFLVPGDANIRVVVHPHKINAPAATAPASYEISQVQNPALTIETSADPLLYGQAATIKGVVAGAAPNTPVTLLGHSRGAKGTGFAAVATGHTGAGGAYEFSATPLTNTAYRVSSATTNSAILFEGVKYALTVAPPPSTVQSGQPATFSGSVLPALAGHVVYLERQNSLKLGWHVVDVGTIGAPAKVGDAAPFSIVHAFFAPGVDHLRIQIPGDPGNQGAAGAAFDLNVTPAPAAALRPEAPGNSRLPGEGQL
jgi:hypothetical protein